MQLQILFVGLFALNLILTWLAIFTKKFGWYRVPGVLFHIIIPSIMVFPEQPRFELDYFWWRIAGVVAILIGLGIFLWARLEFSKLGLKIGVGITPQRMITSGPYQYVRHPQYLSTIFLCVGWWWVWAAVYAFYFGMFILALTWIEAYLEEKLILEKQFGDEYREYKHHTGMFWIK